MTLGAMEAHEDAVGQCGLYPLLSTLVHTCTWLSNGTGLISDDMLDKAILTSRLWDREEEVVHGLDVHQRAGETTAIEYACTPPCATRLCATDDGQSVLQCLLDHSDPERLREFAPDRGGLGLLHRVAASDSNEPGLGWLLRQLVDKGGLDINAMNPALDRNWRVTPMAYHIEQNSFYGAACLLEMGADPSLGDLFDATYFAALRGNLGLLRGIFGYSRANQGKIDWGKSYTWIVSDGEGKSLTFEGTCLHMACYLGHLECTKFFIEEGLVGPGALTADDGTPLHLAAEKGSVHMVDYLVSMGSGVNVMTTKNSTPLHFAAANGHLEVVRALVRLGASSSIDKYGMNPKMCAYSRGHHEIVQFLDEAFQVTNDPERHAGMQRREARAQLQRMKLAIRLGDLAACSACLASGCALDEGITGTGGWSPLDYAVVKGQESIVQLLLEFGASTLIPFKRGKNLYDGALHCASKSEKHIPILQSLLCRYLEEVNSIHEVGWPLMYAISAGSGKVFKLILEHLVQNSQKISQMNQARSEDIVKQGHHWLLSSRKQSSIYVIFGAPTSLISPNAASPMAWKTRLSKFRIFLEHPIAPSPLMPPQNYLASILALEGMGLSSPNRRCNDDAIMALLRKDKVGQSYLLNSEFSLDDLDPFPWHLEAQCTFQELPFLRETFSPVPTSVPPRVVEEMGQSPAGSWVEPSMQSSLTRLGHRDEEFACGRLEAVKFLVRSGAATSYVGRRGFIDVISVARSASVRAWLLVGRFNEQPRISMGEEAGSSVPAQIFPWSGIVQAKLRQVSIGGRMPDESTLDYAKYLVTGKEEMRGLVAANIDGLVYADDVSKSGMAEPMAVLKENHVEQRVEADTDIDTLHSGSSETSPAMLTVNRNHEESWVLDLAKGEYHQPGQPGFAVNIQSQTSAE
ncbi:hypothetical protein CEP52_001697 [Fusarium oligoseptatum]|uniref:Uncharacterized protein n=1 Tax=Fusarium oligoseptatum TaxID=2604345 RepID=A0A428UH52_9HYPO|nr:hypothetical protein CEP52_001697 [Fusarium oligoseptatum]